MGEGGFLVCQSLRRVEWAPCIGTTQAGHLRLVWDEEGNPGERRPGQPPKPPTGGDVGSRDRKWVTHSSWANEEVETVEARFSVWEKGVANGKEEHLSEFMGVGLRSEGLVHTHGFQYPYAEMR